VFHGLKALRASETEIEFSGKNVSIGVIGKDQEFKMLDEKAIGEAILNSKVNDEIKMVPA